MHIDDSDVERMMKEGGESGGKGEKETDALMV